MNYSYGYYPQPNYYQRQNTQRKRKTVEGEEANVYRIIPGQVYLMVGRSSRTGGPPL